MSPYRNIEHKLINRLNIIYNYKEAIINYIISIINLAPYECIFIYGIIIYKYKTNKKEYNIVKNKSRFTKWKCEVMLCPNYSAEFNVWENK